MTTYLQISEGSQAIVTKTPAAEFQPQNDFIARLMSTAKELGEASAEDSEGCEVTCTVWEE